MEIKNKIKNPSQIQYIQIEYFQFKYLSNILFYIKHKKVLPFYLFNLNRRYSE